MKWTRVYQKIPGVSKKSKSLKVQLMLRPRFPPIYNRSTIPDANARAEVVVIVNDDWKVGDLVDWWKDGCYWSGRITEILGNESFKVGFVSLNILMLTLVCLFSMCSLYEALSIFPPSNCTLLINVITPIITYPIL